MTRSPLHIPLGFAIIGATAFALLGIAPAIWLVHHLSSVPDPKENPDLVIAAIGAIQAFLTALGITLVAYYADATIAFMNRDKQALLESRNALATLPRPENLDPRDARGNPVSLTWKRHGQ